jgi:hypothetical protein
MLICGIVNFANEIHAWPKTLRRGFTSFAAFSTVVRLRIDQQAPFGRGELRSFSRASIRWPCGLLSTRLEIIVKAKEPLKTGKSETPKTPDLRNGMHGTLTVKAVDAGQSAIPNDGDLKLATPDLEVPVGQTTHE